MIDSISELYTVEIFETGTPCISELGQDRNLKLGSKAKTPTFLKKIVFFFSKSHNLVTVRPTKLNELSIDCKYLVWFWWGQKKIKSWGVIEKNIKTF